MGITIEDFINALGILLIPLLFALLIALLRWILRINEIVDLLKQIAKTDERDAVLERQSEAKDTSSNSFPKYCCAVCEKECFFSELVKIDSGQRICQQCHKILENKKGEKDGEK